MPKRHLPVRPNLDQLRHQAKDMLKQIRLGDPNALADWQEFHPENVELANAKLAHVQHVLARSYEAPSWPRLVLACNLIDAIWEDDRETVRKLVLKHPNLLHENACIRSSNWGPPMSYAANLGRDAIIQMLHEMGARDHESAIGRAVLQSQIDTARKLHVMLGSPVPPEGCLGGPAYTLSSSGTQLMLEYGAKVKDEQGRNIAPVDVVLETDSRKPFEKHKILELYVQHGLELPDTAPMAIHRGRLDLLERLIDRNPSLLHRRFKFEEIFPPELGCHDEVLATHGTSLAGTTLLHMCIDYDEYEFAVWLLDRGLDPNARADVDPEGFGGHTALFATVVSQPNFWPNFHKTDSDTRFVRLLLERGADPNVRASLRKKVHPGYFEDYMHEYRDVTPLSWGRRFHFHMLVNEAALKIIEEAGGKE